MNPYAEPAELQSLCGRHDGGLSLTPERFEQYLELVSFAQDLCHPEQLGHAVTPEVIRRAVRILKLADVANPASIIAK